METTTKRSRAKKSPTALATRTPKAKDAEALTSPSAVSTFERLARDPAVDVAKMRDLIALQKDILATQAKADFEAAFSKMWPLLPKVRKDGTIFNKDGKSVRSRYARLETIQEAVKPIVSAHRFSIRHRTDFVTTGGPKPMIRITGILSHEGGHSETSTFEAFADASDFRSAVQDQGSTISYGRRYTTIDLLNITIEGVDNDAQAPPASRQREDAPTVHPDANKPITLPQRQRLWTIAGKAGRTKDELKAWLAVAYNIGGTEFLTRKDYDAVIRAIEAPGVLPMPAVDDDRILTGEVLDRD
jgi:hypothetical protein